MRRLLILASLVLLGACNMVVTKAPLFTKADTVGAPQLKPGVWVEKSDGPCDFDETRALADWPSCAKSFVVLDGKIGAYDVDAQGKRTFKTSDLVLAGGDPQIIQLRLADLELKGLGDLPLGPMYLYAAARPTKSDAHGLITAYSAWVVLCGPPPPADTKSPDGHGTRFGTLESLPGLTMDKDQNNCSADSKDAVRAAAAASEPWATADSRSADHWVRAGDH